MTIAWYVLAVWSIPLLALLASWWDRGVKCGELMGLIAARDERIAMLCREGESERAETMRLRLAMLDAGVDA